MPANRDTPQKKANPFAKNTYRVLNEPFKFFGILDWRYTFFAAVPAIFFGLIAHSKIAGGIVFAVLAWQAWRIAEDDPNLPLVLWLTLLDNKHAGGFTGEKTKRKEN